MGKLNYFVASNDKSTTLDEARMSVITFRVIEQLNGDRQAVVLEGDYSDVVEALINSDVIIVCVADDEDPIAEA